MEEVAFEDTCESCGTKTLCKCFSVRLDVHPLRLGPDAAATELKALILCENCEDDFDINDPARNEEQRQMMELSRLKFTEFVEMKKKETRH